MSVVENADHGGMRARKRPNYASIGASVVAHIGDFNDHAIAMHRRSNGMRRDKDVSGQTGLERGIKRVGFGDDEAVAVAMHGQAAD